MRIAGLFIFAFVIAIAAPAFVCAQTAKDVNVVNPTTAPVNVRSVDEPARRAYQVGFEINTPNPVTTPAGKIFVVEHVSGNVRLKTVSGATTPCKFFELGLPVIGIQGSPVESFSLTPTDMGTAPSIGFDLSFYSINNPVKFYIHPNTDLGAMNYSIGGSCMASPIMNSRIVLSGCLADM